MQVFGHGFLTKDGLKMGKSLGNVLDPQALVRLLMLYWGLEPGPEVALCGVA